MRSRLLSSGCCRALSPHVEGEAAVPVRRVRNCPSNAVLGRFREVFGFSRAGSDGPVRWIAVVANVFRSGGIRFPGLRFVPGAGGAVPRPWFDFLDVDSEK